MLEKLGFKVLLKHFNPSNGPMLERFFKTAAYKKDPQWSKGKQQGGRSSRKELLCNDHSPHPPEPLCQVKQVKES